MGIDPYFTDHWTTIYQGSCLAVLPMLPANSVHACITSPPYFGLRDYGTATWAGGDPACAHRQGALHTSPKSTLRLDGRAHTGPYAGEKALQDGMPYAGTCGRCGAVRHDQGLGNEAVHDCLGWATGQPCVDRCWVCRLVAVFREVRRVLRPDGTLWLNCGDAMAATGKSGGGAQGARWEAAGADYTGPHGGKWRPAPRGLKPKDLCMLPARLALALQADGWWLRAECIWHKLNPMPESVTDRPTKAHEQVYLLTKSPRYFYDAEAVKEQTVSLDPAHPSYRPNSAAISTNGRKEYTAKHAASFRVYPAQGRNLRSVWPIASEPTPFAHFATMPSALVRRCLLAACSAGGVCAGCGRPYVRQVERETGIPASHNGSTFTHGKTHDARAPLAAVGTGERTVAVHTTGFAPACACAAGVTSAVFLDPFFGSGTVALVARDLFIKSIGVELSPSYCALAASRLTQGVLALQPGVW